MDYTELLFAFEARKLAIQRIQIEASNAGIGFAEYFKKEDFDSHLAGVVKEMQSIAKKIRELPQPIAD